MQKRFLLKSIVVSALLASTGLMAQEKFKIGLILPMTGPFASTGKQIEAAAKLYIAQNGDMVAGKKVELIVKDDTSAPDVTKRIAQEMVINDKVSVLAGFGLTPLALATAPIATQSKTPLVVLAEDIRPKMNDPQVRADVETQLAQHLKDVNAGLADYEKLRMLVIANEAWSIENGYLTPTMKIKRSRIEAAVESQVDAWYQKTGRVFWA